MEELPSYLLKLFTLTIFTYMILVILTYFIMLVMAVLYLRKQYRLDKEELDEDYIDSIFSKPVSIIVPAFNEEQGVIDSVHSLLSLRYPQTELIVVNDGSTDRTREKLIEQFEMKEIKRVVPELIPTKQIKQVYQSMIHPNLLLIDKENGGKADALNAGINSSRYPYFCSIDGDSILEERSLLRVMKPIIMSNGEVIAAGGNVRIANGLTVQMGSIYNDNLSNNYVVAMQVVEYVRAFLMGRIALSRLNLVLIISGAFSVFSKKWVVEAGGYSTNTIGEDMEIVVKLHRLLKERKSKKKIVFVPDPVCWTEAPVRLTDLRKQRRRWHQGLIESMWKHRDVTFNPRYGRIGLASFPYFLLVECLGPIIELAGYLYIVSAFFFSGIHIEIAIVLGMLFFLHGSILSVASILLGTWSTNTYPKPREMLRLMILALTEIVWYRPLTLLWRMEGYYRFISGKNDWGKLKRTGLSGK